MALERWVSPLVTPFLAAAKGRILSYGCRILHKMRGESCHD